MEVGPVAGAEAEDAIVEVRHDGERHIVGRTEVARLVEAHIEVVVPRLVRDFPPPLGRLP